MKSLGQDLQHPNAQSFPRYLNSDAVHVWQELDGTFDSKLTAFISECRKLEIDPFGTVDTDGSVRNYLAHQRRFLIRYLNRTGILAGQKFRWLHSYEKPTDTGIRITLDAQFYKQDPHWEHALTHTDPLTFSFELKRVGRVWVKHLNKGLTLFAYNTTISNPYRWHFGYNIDIPLFTNSDVLSMYHSTMYTRYRGSPTIRWL